MNMNADLETVESTYRTTYANLQRTGAVTYDAVTTGATDKKGRAIGLRVARWDADLVVLLDTATGEPIARRADRYMPSGVWEPRPGTVFAWQPQATRDGRPYGASQESRAFDTREEREADIAAYVGRFIKRHA
jgi:hypothetical protein